LLGDLFASSVRWVVIESTVNYLDSWLHKHRSEGVQHEIVSSESGSETSGKRCINATRNLD
jgi:hypothetical protein